MDTHYQLVGGLASGERVFTYSRSDTPHSHGLNSEVLASALLRVDSQGRAFINESVKFGGTVGPISCVSTVPTTTVYYAKRLYRGCFSRFVLPTVQRRSSKVVMMLRKIEQGYDLILSYIGEKGEPEPWVTEGNSKPLPFWQEANSSSLAFWQAHALVLGNFTLNCYICGEEVVGNYVALNGVVVCEKEHCANSCRGWPTELRYTGAWGSLPFPVYPLRPHI